MAYTIIRSDGTVLTTIQDGTINTTSTSLGLPGRNKAGYGQTLDTNLVRMVEHFANDSPPAHPLKGQLWYDTNTSPGVLRVCPADNTTVAADWPALASTSSSGNTVVPNLLADETISGNNLNITNAISSNTITVTRATVSSNLVANLANVTTANIGTTYTKIINAGSTTELATLTGKWSMYGSGNTLTLMSGNIAFNSDLIGIKCGNYMNTDGTPFTPTGTYTNANVAAFLSDSDPDTGFADAIYPSSVTTSTLSGAGVGAGTIEGIWTLATGAKIQATYADLAERYEADAEYDIGTVVDLGGDKEVTISSELSEQVFGVVSNTYAYLMNEGAGTDATHPAIALAGRVKVKVAGTVSKHERLVSAGNGVARAAKPGELTAFNSIGRALEEKLSEDIGLIEAVVVIK